jgi:hypothetical protein
VPPHVRLSARGNTRWHKSAEFIEGIGDDWSPCGLREETDVQAGGPVFSEVERSHGNPIKTSV